jgi:uncharacterized membrane protein YeaQ/YmgE (transglycosylase-associated protein family)
MATVSAGGRAAPVWAPTPATRVAARSTGWLCEIVGAGATGVFAGTWLLRAWQQGPPGHSHGSLQQLLAGVAGHHARALAGTAMASDRSAVSAINFRTSPR